MYCSQKLQEIEEAFINFRAHNESKNIFKTAKTPATIFTVAVICYIVSGLFGLFGMYTFANMFNLMMGVCLLVLALWAYVRYFDFECFYHNSTA